MARRSPRDWGTVRKLPSGRYQAQTAPDPLTGSRIPLGTYRTRDDATRALRQAAEKRDQGAFVAPAAGKHTFATAAASWAAGRLVRPSTAQRDADYLRSLILPHLGAHELRRITPAVLRTWIATLAAEKAPSTVVKAGQIASMVLQQAVEDRQLDANPMKSVRLPRVEPTRRRALTDEQVAAVAAQIAPRYRPLVLTMAFAALRPGEAVALQVDDLNLLRREITVRRTAQYVGGKLEVGPPKTPRGVRTVPIPPALADLLAAHIAAHGLQGDSLLFTGPSGNHLRTNNFVRRHWTPALAVAGIEVVDLHQLRHTGATRWAREGVDPATIARRLGHETPMVALQVYIEAQEGRTAADDRIDELAAEVIAKVAARVHDECTVTPIARREAR